MASLVGFGLLMPVLLLGVVVLAVASAGAGRTEPDPDGERPFALYLAAVAFVAIFLCLGAFSAIVASAVAAGLGDDGPSGISSGQGLSVRPGQFEGSFQPVPEPIIQGQFD